MCRKGRGGFLSQGSGSEGQMNGHSFPAPFVPVCTSVSSPVSWSLTAHILKSSITGEKVAKKHYIYGFVNYWRMWQVVRDKFLSTQFTVATPFDIIRGHLLSQLPAFQGCRLIIRGHVSLHSKVQPCDKLLVMWWDNDHIVYPPPPPHVLSRSWYHSFQERPSRDSYLLEEMMVSILLMPETNWLFPSKIKFSTRRIVSILEAVCSNLTWFRLFVFSLI